MTEYEKKRIELEEAKVKHLEKLATCVDILTLWFEEIDKEEVPQFRAASQTL